MLAKSRSVLVALAAVDGVDVSLVQSNPSQLTRRQLLLSLAKESRSVPVPSKARALVMQSIQRIADTIVAGYVMEAAISFSPRFRGYVRSTYLPGMREQGFTEDMLDPINVALEAAIVPLQQDGPVTSSVPSRSSSGSAVIPMAGVPGMLQRAFHTCCVCLYAQGQTCLCGLKFCPQCIKRIGASLSGGQCRCQTIVSALLRGVCRQGEKAASIKRQNLLVNSDHRIASSRLPRSSSRL